MYVQCTTKDQVYFMLNSHRKKNVYLRANLIFKDLRSGNI